MAKHPELTDSKGNKIQSAHVYVFADTLESIQAEQNRLRKTEGRKPSAAIVVERMWEAYKTTVTAERAGESASAEPELVAKLKQMLQDPDLPQERLDQIRLAINAYQPKEQQTAAEEPTRTGRRSQRKTG